MKRDSGLTLVELMVVISIIAIMSAVAIPNLISWLPNYRLNGAAREVLSAIELARLTAVRENASVAVTFTPGNAAYHLWVDNGEGGGGANDFTQNGTERTLRGGPMPPSIAMSSAVFGASSSFRFNGTGLPLRTDGSPGGGAVVLTNSKGKTLTVTLSSGGNARIQ